MGGATGDRDGIALGPRIVCRCGLLELVSWKQGPGSMGTTALLAGGSQERWRSPWRDLASLCLMEDSLTPKAEPLLRGWALEEVSPKFL